MKSSRTFLSRFGALAALAVLAPSTAAAFSSGVNTSLLAADPVNGCSRTGCHTGGLAPTVILEGPSTVTTDSTNEYTVRILEIGTQDQGGFNVFAPSGTMAVGGANAGTTKTVSGPTNTEVTHSARKPAVAGEILFSFLWQAPSAAGLVDMEAWGNAANGNFTTSGDLATKATLSVTVEEPAVASGTHFMEYKVKESDKKAVNGALAKGCNVTLDDPYFDFADGEDSAENYEVSKARSLGLPADKNEEGGVDLNGTHLLGLQIKPAKQGALAVADGKFPKGRKHARRTGVEVTISNPTFHDGSGSNTIRLDTTKVTRLLVPSNKDEVSVPGVPSDDTNHYKCYKAGASKTAPFGTLQDSKGKELKNLQVLVEDQFADGKGHPVYGDARVLALGKVTEICNPVTKDNIDTGETDAKGETRTSTCTVTPAVVSEPFDSLICWQAKVASSDIPQPWDGVSKGVKIDPKQGKHTKFSIKTGTQLFVGHQFVAPEQLDTSKELSFCMPAEITDPGTVN